MLKRKQRLSKKTPPRQVLSKTFSLPSFSLKIQKNDLSFHRFRFVISKKVDKRAVGRNALKRRMTACVSLLDGITPGYDMIFYMKKAALELSPQELEAQIKELRITK